MQGMAASRYLEITAAWGGRIPAGGDDRQTLEGDAEAMDGHLATATGQRPGSDPALSALPGPIGHRLTSYRWKDLLVGPPLATARLARERLRQLVALAVFSSDAISSTA
jgi:hypothetical protein